MSTEKNTATRPDPQERLDVPEVDFWSAVGDSRVAFRTYGSVAIAVLENSRINSFVFWRKSAVRTAELIGLRPVRLPAVGSQSQPVASEIRREAN